VTAQGDIVRRHRQGFAQGIQGWVVHGWVDCFGVESISLVIEVNLRTHYQILNDINNRISSQLFRTCANA
jgi:hypothetical protein